VKKIKTWIKLDNHFIDQDNIRSVARLGKKTRIERILGDAIVVDVDYKKIVSILPKENN
jgi:hypothetical protein